MKKRLIYDELSPKAIPALKLKVHRNGRYWRFKSTWRKLKTYS